MWGIRVEASANTVIRCNAIYDIGNGLMLSQVHTGLTMVKNRMNNNFNGLFLNSGCQFNEQLFGPTASENMWENFAAGNKHTFCYYSNGSLSRLNTRNSGTYKPVVGALDHLNGSPLNVVSSDLFSRYDETNTVCTTRQLRLMGDSTIVDYTDSLALRIANGEVLNLPIYSTTGNWVARYNLFNSLNNNQQLVQTNAAFTNFTTNSNNNTIKELSNNHAGQSVNAFALNNLNSINNCEANLIKVRKMVNLFVNKQIAPKGALAQLTAIANACPYQDGPAVYEARAFLSGFTGNTVYTNACEVPVQENIVERNFATFERANTVANLNNILIYPNPVDNLLNIVLSNGTEALNYSIKNYLGQTVLTGALDKTNTTINVEELGKAVYVIDVNINGHTQQYKFVKE